MKIGLLLPLLGTIYCLWYTYGHYPPLFGKPMATIYCLCHHCGHYLLLFVTPMAIIYCLCCPLWPLSTAFVAPYGHYLLLSFCCWPCPFAVVAGTVVQRCWRLDLSNFCWYYFRCFVVDFIVVVIVAAAVRAVSWSIRNTLVSKIKLMWIVND